MKNTEHKTLWMVSNISAFIGEGISSSMDNLVVWYTDKGEIHLDTEKLEVGLVDCTMDLMALEITSSIMKDEVATNSIGKARQRFIITTKKTKKKPKLMDI